MGGPPWMLIGGAVPRRGRRSGNANRWGFLRSPNAYFGEGEKVGDGGLGFWRKRDTAPTEPEPLPTPAAGDTGCGSQVPHTCFPAHAGCFARDASIQHAELQDVAAELTIFFICLSDAREFEDKQRGCDVPQPECRRRVVSDLVVNVEG